VACRIIGLTRIDLGLDCTVVDRTAIGIFESGNMFSATPPSLAADAIYNCRAVRWGVRQNQHH
jgi:hypothetical protein